MPTYTFRDKKTGEEQVLTMTISEAEKFSKKNKHLDWLCGAPGFGDAFKMGLSSMRRPRGLQGPHQGHQEVPHQIDHKDLE